MKRAAAAAFALVLWRAADALAQGCAMCASSLPGAEDPLAQGFNYSIFMFLGVTYGLITVGGSWIGYMYWRAAQARRTPSQVLAFHRLQKEEQS